MTNSLFDSKLSVINVGLQMFADDITAQGTEVAHLQWTPPGGGKPEIIAALDKLAQPQVAEKIEAANAEVVKRITEAKSMLVSYGKALDVVPGMTPTTILHAGPPVKWEDMSGPMKGAVTGAIVFEGLAKDLDEAAEVAASGKITFSPCHEHSCVGSMAGVTSASMYMHVVKNETHGNYAYTNLSEQLAKILRMGANDQSVIDRLVWMRDVFGPLLAEAVEITGPIDLRLLLSQAIHMGDEAHNRNGAGTLLTMARNGVEHGLRVAGQPANRWFVGPAQQVIGPMFAGYKPEDSGLDIGDSAITETYGYGGFAMAAAPAIVSLVGGTVEEAMAYSLEMLEITTTTNPNVTIPALGFLGLPTGIDVRKVVETGILPLINTAIAHKEPGIGMIGAGITHPPMEAFEKAILALAEELG